jgi:PiT family inorganic phosphate transporter
MDATTLTLLAVVVLALVFDFTNGFHDTANSIATMVGTRALSPQLAVALAASLNFVGAFWSLEVAATVGKDIISSATVSNPDTGLLVVLGGLAGAICWNVVTWFFGIPSSSSHALIGGLMGSAIAADGMGAVQWGNVSHKIIQPAVMAPLLGGLGALVLMAVLMRIFARTNPARSNRLFRRAQVFSGAWLSFTHGTNDAQKTMGIMALALASANGTSSQDFSVPTWVVFSAASAMALGTYAGGWKIIKTLGGKVVKMSPIQGFSASTSAASVLYITAHMGFPVSTTHCVSGCVMGAGASKRLSSVRWNVAFDIMTAWVVTIPCAAVVGAMAFGLAMISPLALIAVLGVAWWYMNRHQRQGDRALAH